MPLVAIVILLALVEYLILGGLVGRARGKYGLKAPATSGNEMFERHFRVHYNTLEQIVVFVPAIWLFGTYVSANWAAGLGLLFIIGRAAYAVGYVSDPRKREIGALLTFGANAPLVLGALYGAIRAAIG